MEDESKESPVASVAPPTTKDIVSFLNGNEGREEIINALEKLQQLGVHGIPKFIIEGQTVVDGASPSELFVDIFRQIESRGMVHSSRPIFGNILGLPEEIISQGSHSRDLIR